MKVVFFGTPDFAVPTLDALAAAGHAILGVVAQPDRPKGRGMEAVAPPTVQRARTLGLAVHQPTKIKSGPFPEWFAACGADVGVVVAYGRILPKFVLDAPRLGCINVHASLLPRYRGAAPIQWAVIRGEQETGCVTMQMDEGLDTGPILLEARTPIGRDETAGELFHRLAPLGAGLLKDTLDRLPTLQPRAQDNANATLAPPLTRDHGRIDWTSTAAAIHDLVRGTNPWPGAFAPFRGDVLKVHRTRLAPRHVDSGATAGALLGDGFVMAADGPIELLEVQLPNRKRQSGVDFMRGQRLAVGDPLV